MSKKDRVLVEVTIPASADTVWRALRDKDQLAQWFGWDADTLAGEIDYIFFQHTQADDAARVLTFAGTPDRFEVEGRGAEAVLRLIRSAPVDAEDWENIYDDITEGWIAFAHQLRFLLTRHAGQQRRTLYLSGTPRAEGGPNGERALGLDASAAVGAQWSAPVGPEPVLGGDVWHRGRHQAGLTVKEWGDGLLVVTARPPGEKAPRGASSVTLTTYGLAPAAFDALRDRWTAWWASRFVEASPPAAS